MRILSLYVWVERRKDAKKRNGQRFNIVSKSMTEKDKLSKIMKEREREREREKEVKKD